MTMNKFRGKYIDESGLKWMVGEDVEIKKEICTASINGQYIIWDSLEKFAGVDDDGKDIWLKF